ncbi:ABC transporter permease [Pigmentiphaga soli]|uniref:ABC transporter permease n=1 Tax=Pigmentiphaga soli TaxID=1007095 RepID=A0ABP8H9P9_9BURK
MNAVAGSERLAAPGRSTRAAGRPARGRMGGRVACAAMLAVTYLFLLGPILYVAIASFDYGQRAYVTFPPEHFTLDSYRNIPARYYDALWLSVRLALACAVLSSLLGISAAIGLVRSNVPGKAVLLALMRAPLQIPGVVSGLAFLQAYYMVGDLTGWYANNSFAGLLIAHTFAATPYVVGTLVAVLQRFDGALEEAALVLGASRWGAFVQVTLPVLKPGVFTGALYAFMVSFSEVPISVFLTGPQRVTFPVEVFNSMQFDFEPTILAVSTLVTVFSLAAVLAVQKLFGLDVFVKTGGAD